MESEVRFDQCVAGLSQEKMQKVSSFRTTANVALAKSSLPSMTLSQAVKYLYAAKFDVRKAEEIFRNYQRFHSEYGLSELRKQSLNAEIRSKKLEILGARDSDGAQILLLTASRHDVRLCDHKTAVQLLFLLLDQISESSGTQSKGVTLLVDLQCCNPLSCDTKYTSTILSILDGGYPLYLNMVYIIEPPGWFKIGKEQSFITLQKNGKTKMASLADLSSLISPSSLPSSLSGGPKKSPPASGLASELTTRTKSPPKTVPPLTPPPRSDKHTKKQNSVPSKSSTEPTVEELQLTGNVNKMKDIFQATPLSPPPVSVMKPHPPNRSLKPYTNGISSPSHKLTKPVKATSIDIPSTSRPLSPPQKATPVLPPPTKQKPSFAPWAKGPKVLKKSDSYDHLDAKVTMPISASSFSAEEVIFPHEEEEGVINKEGPSDDFHLDNKSSSRPSFSSNGKKFFANLKSRQQETPPTGGGASEKTTGNKFGQVFKQKKTTPTTDQDVADSKKPNGIGGKVPVKIFGKKDGGDVTKTENKSSQQQQQPGSPSKWSRPLQPKMLLSYENVSVKPTKPLERIINTETHPSDSSPTQNAIPTSSTQPYKVTVISPNGPSTGPPTLPEYAIVNKTNKAPSASTISPPTLPEYAVVNKTNKTPPTHKVSPPTLPEYAVVNKTNKAPPTHNIAPPIKGVSPPPLLPPQYSDDEFNSCAGGNERLQRNPYENIFFLGGNEEDEDEGEILNDFKDDEIIYENFGPDRGNRWMTTNELQQYINDKGKRELSVEYLKIKNEPLIGSSENFKLSCNTSKNRYKDVVCYDSTRVALSKQEDVEGSDYIHANYINGYKKEKAVILTQGPLKRTVNDYWRMLWEQEVFVIVMATKCIETRKLKCAQYWPDGGGVATFGDIMVKVVYDEVKGPYQFRQFSASRNGETRSLMHYQFLAWPDYGVPATGSEVLDVLYAARAMQECFREHVQDPDRFPIHGPPMVIHCSAGIGRSGTFCSLDYCIDELRMTNKVNVQNCVRLLRKQRAFSIQTDEQYIFCYQTVLDYALYLKEALQR